MGNAKEWGVPIRERVVGLDRQGTAYRHRKITARSENKGGMGGKWGAGELPNADSTV